MKRDANEVFGQVLARLNNRKGVDLFTLAQKDALTGAITHMGDELKSYVDEIARSMRADRQDIRNKLIAHLKEHKAPITIQLPKAESGKSYTITDDPAKEKMHPLMLEALKASIRIYIRRAKGEILHDDCPLCALAKTKTVLGKLCGTCVVSQKTGTGCSGTPWEQWSSYKPESSTARKYAYDEAKFLFDLLPDEENAAEFIGYFYRKEMEKRK